MITEEYPEDEGVTAFPEDTLGIDNTFYYEEVRRIPDVPDDPNESSE